MHARSRVCKLSDFQSSGSSNCGSAHPSRVKSAKGDLPSSLWSCVKLTGSRKIGRYWLIERRPTDSDSISNRDGDSLEPGLNTPRVFSKIPTITSWSLNTIPMSPRFLANTSSRKWENKKSHGHRAGTFRTCSSGEESTYVFTPTVRVLQGLLLSVHPLSPSGKFLQFFPLRR